MKASDQSNKSKQDYGTPYEFIQSVENKLNRRIAFDLAADEHNCVVKIRLNDMPVKRHFDINDNALVQDWNATLQGCLGWLNPPFEDISPWVEKAYKESRMGANIAVLVPLSIAKWWRDWVDEKAYVFMLHGRLTFQGETKPYPKDCALLIYGPTGYKGYEVWDWR